jgi:hypothetical protein
LKKNKISRGRHRFFCIKPTWTNTSAIKQTSAPSGPRSRPPMVGAV